MPLWWVPVDASIFLVPGIAAYALSSWGRRRWAHVGLVGLFPVSAAVMYAGAGWPVFLLLNTGQPAPVVWAAGVPAVTISVAMFRGLVRVAARLEALRRTFSTPSQRMAGAVNEGTSPSGRSQARLSALTRSGS